jgi:hypothetical protein
MILPTKHISTEDSLLGIGAVILGHMSEKETVTHLWESVRSEQNVATFERFILALDLLYMIDAISIEDGLLRKRRT